MSDHRLKAMAGAYDTTEVWKVILQLSACRHHVLCLVIYQTRNNVITHFVQLHALFRLSHNVFGRVALLESHSLQDSNV